MLSRELEDVLVSCLFFDENNLGICLYFGSEYNDIIQAKQDIKKLLQTLDNVEKVNQYIDNLEQQGLLIENNVIKIKNILEGKE